MKAWNWCLLIATLVAVLPATARGEDPPKVAVTPRWVNLSVTLAPPPNTRVRVTFDVKGSPSQAVEWDPLQPAGMTRTVRLKAGKPRKDGAAGPPAWSASVWAEPTPISSGGVTHYLAATFYDNGAKKTCDNPPAGAAPVDLLEGRTGSVTLCGYLADTVTGSGSLGMVQKLRLVIDEADAETTAFLPNLPFGNSPVPPGARALDPVSGIANELLKVIAEVAVERAKTRGFQLLSDQIRLALCEELKWTPQLLNLFGRVVAPPGSEGRILPKTCKAVETLRMQELTSSVKAIYPALVKDIVALSALGIEQAVQRSTLSELQDGDLTSLFGKYLGFWITHPAMLQKTVQDAEGIFASVQKATEKDGNPSPAEAKAAAVDAIGFLQKHIKELPIWQDCVKDGPCPQADAAEALKDVVDNLGLFGDAATLKDGAVKALAALKKARISAEAIKTLGDLETKLAAKDANMDALLSGPEARLLLEKMIGHLVTFKGVSGFVTDLVQGRPPLEAFTHHSANVVVALKDFNIEVPAKVDAALKGIEPLLLIVDAIAPILVDAATGAVPTDRAAQLLVAKLGDQSWSVGVCASDPNSAACDVACGAEIGLGLLKVCAERSSGCSADDIERLVKDPAAELDIEKVCLARWNEKQGRWKDLDKLVLDGLEIVRPRPDATPRSITLAAVRLTFSVIERQVCLGDKQQSAACTDVKDMREVGVAILQDDVGRALIATASLLGRMIDRVPEAKNGEVGGHGKALRKITRLLGAFTAYASTYSTDPKGDEQKIKELHEARKAAVESLIDAMTDRTERGGEWVFSVGVNVGLGVGGMVLQQPASRCTLDVPGVQRRICWGDSAVQGRLPQLQLPMGIALEYLPPTGGRGPREGSSSKRGLGGHFQLSLLDLAQFLAYDEKGTVAQPTWGNAFMIGGQAGFLIGNATNNLFLGLDWGYAPTLFSKAEDPTKGSGAFRFGVTASYYVPLLDFN